MSYELKDRQMDGEQQLYRQPSIPKEVLAYEEPVDMDKLLEGLSLSRLNATFQDVIKRQEDKIDPVRSKFGKIEKEEVSLSERLDYVENYARNHRKFSFRTLLEKQAGKMKIVVTFLAILELMKIGTIRIHQERIFDDIIITSMIG